MEFVIALVMMGGLAYLALRFMRGREQTGRDREVEATNQIREEWAGASGGVQKKAAVADTGGYDYELVETWGDSGGHGLVVRRLADGQKLRWQTLPKREGLESINVVGEGHRLDALQSSAFAPGNPVLLKPEPTNEYDPNAIAVYDKGGQHHIGYIPREDCPRILKKMQNERFACLAMWETIKNGQRGFGGAGPTRFIGIATPPA